MFGNDFVELTGPLAAYQGCVLVCVMRQQILVLISESRMPFALSRLEFDYAKNADVYEFGMAIPQEILLCCSMELYLHLRLLAFGAAPPRASCI